MGWKFRFGANYLEHHGPAPCGLRIAVALANQEQSKRQDSTQLGAVAPYLQLIATLQKFAPRLQKLEEKIVTKLSSFCLSVQSFLDAQAQMPSSH
jgi:hypothetical protein